MDKIAEFKENIYDMAMEKKAFYGRRGMRPGSFLTNRAVKYEKDGILYREASLTTQQRNSLSDNEFGMPKERKFPMPDAEHVYLAWKSIDKANITEGEKVKLRQKILTRAKEMKIDTKGWSKK